MPNSSPSPTKGFHNLPNISLYQDDIDDSMTRSSTPSSSCSSLFSTATSTSSSASSVISISSYRERPLPPLPIPCPSTRSNDIRPLPRPPQASMTQSLKCDPRAPPNIREYPKRVDSLRAFAHNSEPMEQKNPHRSGSTRTSSAKLLVSLDIPVPPPTGLVIESPVSPLSPLVFGGGLRRRLSSTQRDMGELLTSKLLKLGFFDGTEEEENSMGSNTARNELKRYSSKWIKEKKGKRRVEKDYEQVLQKLRKL